MEDGGVGALTIRQAEQALEQSDRVLSQGVKDCYKWVLNPFEEMVNGRPVFKWETASVAPGSSNFISTIENKLKEEEWVIHEWAPIHLSNLLKQWYFKESTQDVITKKVFNDMASYVYMPRLLNEDVLRAAITQGIMSEDFFGYAQGKEGTRYLGLIFGTMGSVKVDESSLLIAKDVAQAHRHKEVQTPMTPEQSGGVNIPGSAGIPGSSIGAGPVSGKSGGKTAVRFFATKDLNATTPKIDFTTVVDKVLLQLTSRHSAHVGISIEVTAIDPSGFDEATQRALRQSCESLGFKQVDFSGE